MKPFMKRISKYIYLFVIVLSVFLLIACAPNTATESSNASVSESEEHSEMIEEKFISKIAPDDPRIEAAKQGVKEYCEAALAENPTVLSFEFVDAEVNWDITNFSVSEYREGVIAEREGWNDDILSNHFLAIVATYDAEYSEEVVETPDPGEPGLCRIKTCYLLVEDSNGVWSVWSGMPFGTERLEDPS